MDGQWIIVQHAPTAGAGVKVTVIPVRPVDTDVPRSVASPTDPFWLHDGVLEGPCLSFAWADGRETYFPWASIVRAEYTPPSERTVT
jgi:hypothetical protein